MSKGKGFDPVQDANELARHNINPHYWINRVTGYTVARWKAQRVIAKITFPMYLVLWLTFIYAAFVQNKLSPAEIARRLFDFGNSAALASQVQLLLLLFYTVAWGILFFQAPPPADQPPPETRKERKKKFPKRRKDWH